MHLNLIIKQCHTPSMLPEKKTYSSTPAQDHLKKTKSTGDKVSTCNDVDYTIGTHHMYPITKHFKEVVSYLTK